MLRFKVLNSNNTLIAMLTKDKVIEIFVIADDFCKIFNGILP